MKRRYFVNVMQSIERIVAVDAESEQEALVKAADRPGVVCVLEVFESAEIEGESDKEARTNE